MGNRGKDTTGHVAAAIIGKNSAHNLHQDTKTKSRSKTTRMEVHWVYLEFDGGKDKKWEYKEYNKCVIILKIIYVNQILCLYPLTILQRTIAL